MVHHSVPVPCRTIRDETVKKGYALFECTNESCTRKWKSYHGWMTENNVEDAWCCPTENCFGVAKAMIPLDEAKVETITVFVFICPHPHCNRTTDRIGGEGTTVPRDMSVACNHCKKGGSTCCGTYEKKGYIVPMKCSDCKCTWNRPVKSVVQPSQRCRACNNRGQLLGFKKMDEKDEKAYREKKRNIAHDDRKRHYVEGCDMCQEVKKSTGNPKATCTRMRKAKIQETVDEEDGSINSRVFGEYC